MSRDMVGTRTEPRAKTPVVSGSSCLAVDLGVASLTRGGSFSLTPILLEPTAAAVASVGQEYLQEISVAAEAASPGRLPGGVAPSIDTVGQVPSNILNTSTSSGDVLNGGGEEVHPDLEDGVAALLALSTRRVESNALAIAMAPYADPMRLMRPGAEMDHIFESRSWTVAADFTEAITTRFSISRLYVIVWRLNRLGALPLGLSPQRRTAISRRRGWTSALVRPAGARGGVSTGGLASWWRSNDGEGMMVYSDGPAVLDWIEQMWSLSPETRNRLMHALNGNTQTSIAMANYYEVLADEESAEMQMLEELCFVSKKATAVADFDVGLDDRECCIRNAVAAVKFMRREPSVAQARLWNQAHAIMDSAGPAGDVLSCGPRLSIAWDLGPDNQKKIRAKSKDQDKGGGKKSPSKQLRDAQRQTSWLASMNGEMAEAWVRARRPDPAVVPQSTAYLDAYSSRSTRGAFYGSLGDDAEVPHVFLIPSYVTDVISGADDYIGPMSLALIRRLLQEAGIERNPGPMAALAVNNFGFTGKTHANAVSAGVNFILATQLDQIDVVGWPLDVNDLDPLARPAMVPGAASVGYNGPADWTISVSYPNAIGNMCGQPYRRIWRGEWAIETSDDFGAIVDFPDDAMYHRWRLVGKVFTRDAAGNVEVNGPQICIYRNIPNVLMRGVRARSALVIVAGGGGSAIQIAYFRGVNTVAVDDGSTFTVPTAAWAECEKFFASGIKRQVATSNASQVLRNADVPGEHFGTILLALSEAMLPSAAVSAAVAIHREAAIERAKRGQSLRYGWVESVIGRGPINPDYHGMMVSTPEPPWQAVWAIRLAIAVGSVGICFNAGSAIGAAAQNVATQAVELLDTLRRCVGVVGPEERRAALLQRHRYNPLVMPLVAWRGMAAVMQTYHDPVNTAREIVPLSWIDWLYGLHRGFFPKRPFSASCLPWHWCSILLAPVMEETARRVNPLVTPALIVGETFKMVLAGQPLLQSFVDRATIHGLFHLLPFHLALPGHIAFNLWVESSESSASERFLTMGWGLLQKGLKWYGSEPMGIRSNYDDYFVAHSPPVDPLMHLTVKPKRLYQATSPSGRVYSLLPPIIDLTSYKSNRGNYVQSAVGRVGRVTPQITDQDLLDAVQTEIFKLADICRAKHGIVEPVPFEEFVEKFPAAKAKAYREAEELFDAVGTRPIFDKRLYKDFKADECAAFIKHELNADVPDLVTMVAGVRFESAATDCRTILPRWLPLQAKMIPYILAMEHNVKEVLVDLGPALFGRNVRFASGLNNRELGEMARELMLENGLDSIIVNGDDAMFTVRGVAYYVDGKRWDAHFRSEHHHCIIDAYARMGLPSYLAVAMHSLVFRKIKWGFGISAEIDRNNASGESDTTFRNGIQNLITLLVCLREGDFLERAMSLGFVYEVCAEQVDVRAPLGDFCARTWIHTESGGELILKVGRVTAKMCSTGGSSVPFIELRVAKVEAAIRDLSAFPEICASLARLNCGAVSTARAMAWVKAQRYDKTEASNVVTSLEQRTDYFALRYSVAYSDYVDELEVWVSDVLRGQWPSPGPAMRLVSEFDMAVSPIQNLPGTKKINVQGTLLIGGASARRIEDTARPAWLASMWNRLMHALTGNGSWWLVVVCALLHACLFGRFDFESVSAGGRERREFILVPEQTLSYQRYQTTMPNKGKNNNKNAAVPQFATNSKKAGGAKGKKKTTGALNRSMSSVGGSIKGDGLYRLLGPLAKMAVRAALPGVMQAAGSRLSVPLASRIQGAGDYVCNDIVHMGGGHQSVKGNQGVPVTKYTHSEFVKDLVVPAVPTAFSSQQFAINAADATTFPWLSRLASLYTKYKFSKLLFEFRTTTSNYSAAGTLGTVVMAPHYNVDSATFPSKQTMEAATHAVSSAPSNSVIMGFECAKKDANVSWYNVLNDVTVARGNFTDAGYVEVATSGLPGTAGTTLGELWVHYTCELIEPFISQAEQFSTGVAMPVTRFIQSSSAAAALMDNGVFGFQYSAVSSFNDGSIPIANYQKGYVSTAVPTAGDWFAYLTGDAGAKAVGFRYAGTYLLRATGRLSAVTTTSTGAPYDITGIAGTVTVISGNNSSVNSTVMGSPSTWYSYSWLITVSAGATVTTTRNAGWTGTALLQLPVNELLIVKVG